MVSVGWRKTMNRLLTYGAVVLAILTLASSGFAQVTGRIYGSVVDPSGAQVPNAQVELRVQGGETAILTTTTTSEGIYVFAGVQPGTYDLSVTASGFSSRKIQVQVS